MFLKFGTHYRVHGPCWSPVYPTRPVNTGVIFDTRVHGPCPLHTARGHGSGSVYRVWSYSMLLTFCVGLFLLSCK